MLRDHFHKQGRITISERVITAFAGERFEPSLFALVLPLLQAGGGGDVEIERTDRVFNPQ